MGRIADAFTTLKRDGKKGFIPYITAGDPDLASTEQLLVTLAQHATLVELGVPFSDPMADGPVIQRASERALKNNFGLQDILDTAARARKRIDTPIIRPYRPSALLIHPPCTTTRDLPRAINA